MAHGIHAQPWHSAHARLAITRHLPDFWPGFAQGMDDLCTRIGRRDLDITITFTLEGDEVHTWFAAGTLHNDQCWSAMPFTTIAEMEAVANDTSLRPNTP